MARVKTLLAEEGRFFLAPTEQEIEDANNYLNSLK